MRLKSPQLLAVFFVLVCAIQVQAGFFDWFGGGDSSSSSSTEAASSTPAPASSTQQQQSSPAPSSQAPASLTAAPQSSSGPANPSSSAKPSPTPSSTESGNQKPTTEHSSKDTSSDSQSSASASASSSTPTATNQKSEDNGDNNNTAIIIGSVVAFVVVIGAAFGFAIFARKKRASRKRLYDEFHNNSPSNQNAALAYESRPSPAMAAAAVAAADDIHQQPVGNARPWEAHDYHDQQQYAPYGQTAFSPQMPPATVTDQYYSQPMTHPVMSYPDAAISGAYYTHVPYQNNGQYYDNTYNNYSPYMASPSPAPMQPPAAAAAATIAAPIYSPPNAYDDNDAAPSPKPQTAAAAAPSPVPSHQMQEVHSSNKWQAQ